MPLTRKPGVNQRAPLGLNWIDPPEFDGERARKDGGAYTQQYNAGYKRWWNDIWRQFVTANEALDSSAEKLEARLELLEARPVTPSSTTVTWGTITGKPDCFPACELPELPDISGKEDKSNKGIAGGYAPLDAFAKLPLVNLPIHHTRHELGGIDAIKLDDLSTPDDNVDLDASVLRHGLLRKLSGNATDVLDGLGNWVSAVFAFTFGTLDGGAAAMVATEDLVTGGSASYTGVAFGFTSFSGGGAVQV